MNATPYSESWNFGIQRELPASMLLNVEYIGQESTHQYFGIGGNYNINHLGAQEEQMSPAQIQALNTQVANPFYGIIPNSYADLQHNTSSTFPILNSMASTSPVHRGPMRTIRRCNWGWRNAFPMGCRSWLPMCGRNRSTMIRIPVTRVDQALESPPPSWIPTT